jgi:hypothetical protein
VGGRAIRGPRRHRRAAARPPLSRGSTDGPSLAVRAWPVGAAAGAGRGDRPVSPAPLAVGRLGAAPAGPGPDLGRPHPRRPGALRERLPALDAGPQPARAPARGGDRAAGHRDGQPRRRLGLRAGPDPPARPTPRILVAARRRPGRGRRRRQRHAAAAHHRGRTHSQAPGQAAAGVRAPLPGRGPDHLLHPTQDGLKRRLAVLEHATRAHNEPWSQVTVVPLPELPGLSYEGAA